MRPHKIRKEAVAEIAEAADWYERQATTGLGADLVAEYEARVRQALEDRKSVV